MFHALNRSVDAVSSSAILNKREVAALLKVSQRYVERQVRAGRLRAYRLSHKTIRFRRSDIDQFVESMATAFLLPGKRGAQ